MEETIMIKPIFIHCRADSDYDDRYDTIMMPNGSVAALCQIAENLRTKYHQLLSPIAIDEQYLQHGVERGQERSLLLDYLFTLIDRLLEVGDEPVIFCSLLSYNAEGSLLLLESIKNEYGPNVRTGVGGQLVRISPEAYRNNQSIDCVGVGDAEVILEQLLINKKSYVSGYLEPNEKFHYSSFDYSHYVGIEERLADMSSFQLGPFSNIRQLLTESVRGCSWAYTYKVCDMCSLMDIDTKPNFKPFEQHFMDELNLLEKYGCNWIFDVSNQWLPVVGPANASKWLKAYLESRKAFGEYDINRYVYLTTNSLTQETAPLLKQAGVKVAYVGIDGWDRSTLKALHKTHSGPRQMLSAARDAGIYIRTSLVIGAGLTKDNLITLPEFVSEIAEEFGDTILSWGNFLEIILPGSPVWYDFQKSAHIECITEAKSLYELFHRKGFLTWEQQEKLTELYIRYFQPVSYEKVVEAKDLAKAAIDSSSIIGVTIREGGRLEQSKPS